MLKSEIYLHKQCVKLLTLSGFSVADSELAADKAVLYWKENKHAMPSQLVAMAKNAAREAHSAAQQSAPMQYDKAIPKWLPAAK